MGRDILIIGCGVIGLTTGIRLLEKGYGVRILAHALPPDITSNIAAAYWYPYKVAPEDKVLHWASFSYEKFIELSGDQETGVSVTRLIKLFDRPREAPYWKDIVHNFRQGKRDDLFDGYVDAHISDVPLIETPVYMNYLLNRFRLAGGKIGKLEKKLASLDELDFNEDIVVNCTGLGSMELFNDRNMYPIRGQLVRTTNPGLRDILSDEEGPLGLSYIVPRSNDCILGGTAQENDWNLEIDHKTSEDILRKCTKLEPALNEAEVLEHRVGLRPGRNCVRLEADQSSDGYKLIHNYGHGGAGFTLSWGCAEDVAKLVDNASGI